MHYVIGDIHGCFNEMLFLIAKIESHDPQAQIYFTGDYIDRGPDSYKVVNWLFNNISTDSRYHAILGNHEDFVIDYYNRAMPEHRIWNQIKSDTTDWFKYTETDLRKWTKGHNILVKEDLTNIVKLFSSFPLVINLNIDTLWGPAKFALAHAWAPQITENITDFSNLRIRRDFMWPYKEYSHAYSGARILVHGHYPTFKSLDPNRLNHKGRIDYGINHINIDAGGSFGNKCIDHRINRGCFAAICLETLEEFYVGLHGYEAVPLEKTGDDILLDVKKSKAQLIEQIKCQS